MVLLVITLGVSVALAAVMILLPLVLARGDALRATGQRNPAYIAYFGALGLAFILVEIPMVQRLNIYLGSPTLSLVVVLFSLLVFSGLGSFTTQGVAPESITRNVKLTLWAILGPLVIYALARGPSKRTPVPAGIAIRGRPGAVRAASLVMGYQLSVLRRCLRADHHSGYSFRL